MKHDDTESIDIFTNDDLLYITMDTDANSSEEPTNQENHYSNSTKVRTLENRKINNNQKVDIEIAEIHYSNTGNNLASQNLYENNNNESNSDSSIDNKINIDNNVEVKKKKPRRSKKRNRNKQRRRQRERNNNLNISS